LFVAGVGFGTFVSGVVAGLWVWGWGLLPCNVGGVGCGVCGVRGGWVGVGVFCFFVLGLAGVVYGNGVGCSWFIPCVKCSVICPECWFFFRLNL